MAKKRRLTERKRFATLHETLANPSTSWMEVMTMLAYWPKDAALARAIDVVESVCERWPIQERSISAATVQQLFAGEVPPYWRLVRVLDFRKYPKFRAHPGLFERMVHEGGLGELWTFIDRYEDGDALAQLIVQHVRGLRVLTIGGSRLGDEGVLALAQSDSLRDLLELSLNNNDISDRGARALVDSPHLVQLRTLNLYGNLIDSSMVETIRSAPQWANTTLILHNQRMPASSEQGLDTR